MNGYCPFATNDYAAILHTSSHSIWIPAFAGMSGVCDV
jgi:hypothetical protein